MKKAVKDQLVPGTDLRQLLIELETALAIIEVANNSLRARGISLGDQIRCEVLAFQQGTKAVKAIGRQFHLAIVEVKTP